jgi:hypothetical protein
MYMGTEPAPLLNYLMKLVNTFTSSFGGSIVPAVASFILIMREIRRRFGESIF